jgi:hypothetical protein
MHIIIRFDLYSEIINGEMLEMWQLYLWILRKAYSSKNRKIWSNVRRLEGSECVSEN